METRKNSRNPSGRLSKSSPLPVDYAKIVQEVYTTNFEAGLKLLNEIQNRPAQEGAAPESTTDNRFEVRGAIFADEIVFAVSLVSEDQIAGTTVHCSVDFDPKASSPTAQDLLNLCVDAVGSVFATLLDSEKPEVIEKVASGSLAAFEEVPLEWARVEFDKKRVWLMVDRSNPLLDEMTDRWLAENDPLAQVVEEEHEAETRELFVTGKEVRKTENEDEDSDDDSEDRTIH
jgi:hypothetical protein